jgi:hypothetical protein
MIETRITPRRMRRIFPNISAPYAYFIGDDYNFGKLKPS